MVQELHPPCVVEFPDDRFGWSAVGWSDDLSRVDGVPAFSGRGIVPRPPTRCVAALADSEAARDMAAVAHKDEGLLLREQLKSSLLAGGGKSLCFQAPALVAPRRLGLVVSPLISLMKDQVDTLVENGVAAGLLQQLAGADREGVGGRRHPRGALLAPLCLARAAGRRGQRRASCSWLGRVSVSSRSTKRTASASGATTSGPEYRQLGALRAAVSRRQPARLHRDGDGARAPRHRGAAGSCATPLELVGSFDRPNLVYRVLPRADAEEAAAGYPGAPSRRGRHHLLHVAPGSGRARRVAVVDRRPRAAVPRRARRRASATATRTRSSTKTPTSWSRRSRSAWASIARTCASWSTPARRSRSSTTSRSRAAPAATASRRSACCLLGRRLPEVAGDARAQRRADRRAPRAAARHGALRRRRSAAGTGIWSRTSASATTKADCGACDYCLGELEAVAEPVDHRAQDPVVRRARRPALRRRARRQRAVRQRERAGHRARPPAAQHVRPAARTRRSPEVRGYIEQLSAEGLLRQTDEPVPGAGADRRRRRAAEGRRRAPDLSLARQRRVTEGRAAAIARVPTPSRGRTSITICSIACARSACASPASAACRPTSSSTTPRCASWPG